MKTILNIRTVCVICLLFVHGVINSQVNINNDRVIYSFFVNSVPHGFSFPMIGFVNIANGDFYSIQAGFVNSTNGNLNGAQIGFVNTTNNVVNGVQAGYINLAFSGVEGVQAGFVNVNSNYTQGGQFGFVNSTNESLEGIQVGFVNRTGTQVDGAQVGFANVSGHDTDGIQTGFVNRARKLNGVQLGFVNIADTVESGFPLGFISIVKKGGYKALGFYWDETNSYNLSFKIGLKSIYSVIVASYNTDLPYRISFGAGFGSYLPISKQVFFNPELLTTNIYKESSNEFQQITSLTPNIGFNVTNRLQLTAGPTFNWSYSPENNHTINPGFSLFNHVFNSQNNMNVGFRVGLNYVFDK